ncbi:MAG: hypothetical protein AAGL10_09340 [Pseudomonadota bacterium]
MTRTKFSIALVASGALIALSSPVSADDEQDGASAQAASEAPQNDPEAARQERQAGGGHSKMVFMKTYDTNEDGQVSLGEFVVKREAGYSRRDADRNGSLSKAEYVGEFVSRMDEREEKYSDEMRERQIKAANFRFGFMDADENEIMTAAEFHDSGTRIFKRLDTNEDGFINAMDTAESF